jgi:hypothetical protein
LLTQPAVAKAATRTATRTMLFMTLFSLSGLKVETHPTYA